MPTQDLPAPQDIPRDRQHVLRGRVDLDLAMFGEPFKASRRSRGLRPHGPPVELRARNDTTHQRDEQQQVDGGEPRRGVDVEEAQAIKPWAGAPVAGQVVRHASGIDIALWPDRTRHGPDRQEKQQEQRGPHAGELSPGPAQHAKRTERRQSHLTLVRTRVHPALRHRFSLIPAPWSLRQPHHHNTVRN